jgi:hypothetical protein
MHTIYPNMSQYCLYYLRVSNIVHLVGEIKEYINPKGMGGVGGGGVGGQLKKTAGGGCCVYVWPVHKITEKEQN